MSDPLVMKDILLGGTVEDWKAAEADTRNWGGFWVILRGESLFMGNVPRSAASYYMRSWWAAREAARNPEHPQHESSIEWLKNGTLAINRVPEGEKDWCESAVAVSEIVGMRFDDRNSVVDAVVGQMTAVAGQCERLEKILKELMDGKGDKPCESQ